jgi:hypothetical protein
MPGKHLQQAHQPQQQHCREQQPQSRQQPSLPQRQHWQRWLHPLLLWLLLRRLPPQRLFPPLLLPNRRL